MRKTSVEQLTEAAGISKGSFYKYFESKEMLFLAVLEDIHTEVYQVARDTLEAGRDLPPEDCAAETLLAVCRCLSETGAIRFLEGADRGAIPQGAGDPGPGRLPGALRGGMSRRAAFFRWNS